MDMLEAANKLTYLHVLELHMAMEAGTDYKKVRYNAKHWYGASDS
jgi:hypothetical protein